MINIKGLDKAEVLAALYNAARPQGMGMFSYQRGDMSVEAARDILTRASCHYFDYLKGRVMKVDLSKDLLDPRLYDRDNGDGVAYDALLELLTRPSKK